MSGRAPEGDPESGERVPERVEAPSTTREAVPEPNRSQSPAGGVRPERAGPPAKSPAGGRSLDADFAPDNSLDHRRLGEWESKYNEDARKEQRRERTYLVGVLAFALVGTLVMLGLADYGVLDGFRPSETSLDIGNAPRGAPAQGVFVPALAALLGGLLGGTLFSVKWLYHSVAKLIWHLDRRFWRYLTPWVSAALAMAAVVLIAGDVVSVLDSEAISRPATAYGFGFLIGYFSDTALAKLAELAITLFGTTEKNEDRRAGKVRRRRGGRRRGRRR